MKRACENLAIIQARMGSRRLPGKVLLRLNQDTVLWHIILRLKQVPEIDRIVVATTENSEDDALESYINGHGMAEVFRGSEHDVLERFVSCASTYSPNRVVRVTADDPLKDPGVISRAIRLAKSGNFDYCSNTIEPSYPEGLDVEVVRYSALEQAASGAYLVSDREHVTPFIWRQPECFTLHNFRYHEDLSAMRWTLDYPEDIKFFEHVSDYFRGRHLASVTFSEIVAAARENPRWFDANKNIPRNESYQAQLREEQHEVSET